MAVYVNHAATGTYMKATKSVCGDLFANFPIGLCVTFVETQICVLLIEKVNVSVKFSISPKRKKSRLIGEKFFFLKKLKCISVGK